MFGLIPGKMVLTDAPIPSCLELSSGKLNLAKLGGVIERLDRSTSPKAARPPKAFISQVLVKPSARPTKITGPENPSQRVLTAAKKGDFLTLRRLLDYSKEFKVPLVVDAKGDSALHLAALFGHRGCVDALLNHGVDPNARNAAAETPLHCAAKWGFTSVVQALLDAGTDPHAQSRAGQRAVDVCRHDATLEVLVPATEGHAYEPEANLSVQNNASDVERPVTSRGPGSRRSEPAGEVPKVRAGVRATLASALGDAAVHLQDSMEDDKDHVDVHLKTDAELQFLKNALK